MESEKKDEKKEKNDLGIEVSSADEKKSESKPEKSHKTGKLIGVIVAVILIIVIAGLVILGLGIYQKRWDKKWEGNESFSKLIEILPFPASYVNGEMIRLSDYQKHVAAMKHFYTNFMQIDFSSDEGKQALAEIETQVKDKLNHDALVEQLLAERDIKITDEDLEAEFQTFVAQSGGSEEDAIKSLDQQFGWGNKDDIKKYVVRPVFATRKLQELIGEDEEYKGAAKKRAEDVLAQLKENPDKFAELAQEHSDDPQSGMNGGQLGFFGKCMMVPEFEEAAFALEIGMISELVETPYGYHIIKVTEKGEQPVIKSAEDAEKSESEREKEEQVNASHILFGYFDAWIDQKQKDSDISQWL